MSKLNMSKFFPITLILILKILLIKDIFGLQRTKKNQTSRITDYNLDYTMFTETEFIAAVVYGRLLVCGGTRIHKFWILTSGKCIDPHYNHDLVTFFGPLGIRLGTSEVKKIGASKLVKNAYKDSPDFPIKGLVVAVEQNSILKVETQILHPAYSMQKFDTKPFLLTQADVGLVKLASLPTNNQFIATLPHKPVSKVSGICEAFGWGADNIENTYFIEEDDDGDFSQLLLSLVIKIIPEQDCHKKIQKNIKNVVPEDMSQNYIQHKLCNYDLDSVTLRDVGGPLICEKNVVYGIIDNYFVFDEFKENSILDPTMRPHVVSLFIDIEKYLDWIEETINGTKKIVEVQAIPRIEEVQTSTEKSGGGSHSKEEKMILILLIIINVIFNY